MKTFIFLLFFLYQHLSYSQIKHKVIEIRGQGVWRNNVRLKSGDIFIENTNDKYIFRGENDFFTTLFLSHPDPNFDPADRKGGKFVAKKNIYDEFFFYVEKNDAKMVGNILKMGVKIEWHNGETTVLQKAAAMGHVEVAEILVKNGANVEGEYYYDYSPLLRAIKESKYEMVTFLINKGANVNAENFNFGGGLMLASHKGDEKMVKLLLKYGADINKEGGSFNRTPIENSIITKKKNIFNILLNHSPNLNHQDIHGDTPLIIALATKQYKIAKILIAKGVDVNVKNRQNLSPLDYSLKANNEEITQLLIDNGAK